jgi:hypothetical protein
MPESRDRIDLDGIVVLEARMHDMSSRCTILVYPTSRQCLYR